jgi:type I restriction enzyme S subunit
MTQTEQQNVPKLRFPGFEDGWSRKQVGQVAKLQSGYAFKSENFQAEGIPVVRISNISAKTGIVDLTGAAHHPEISINSKFTVADGDILIALSGATTGKACVFRSENKAYLNQRVGLLRLVDNRNSYQFLQTRIFSKDFEDQLDRVLVAGAQPNIASKDIEGFSFGFPTLPEQRKIASFLGAVDTKITQLAQKQYLLEDYKKGCMQQLFSQKIRFKDDEGKDFPDWEEKRLGDVVVLSAGTSKSKYISASGDRLIVDMGSVTSSGQLMCTKRTQFDGDLLDVGDLVMPKDDIGGGNIIGKVGLIDKSKSYVLGDHVYRLQVTGQNSMFLAYLINSHSINKSLRRKANGTAQLGLARASVLKQLVLLPHPAEQRKIADFLSALDRKIDLVGKELEQAKTFKKCLLQQMFV